MRLEQYLVDSNITYEQYCNGIDSFLSMDEGVMDKITGTVSKVFGAVKSELTKIADEFGVGLEHLVHAFKNKDVFHLMKVVGFNIKTLLKSINSLSKLTTQGLNSVFTEIHKTGVFQKLRSGAMTVDEVMDKYPILKKVTGPAVAGLLFYMWTQMTFIGDMDYDFDFSKIKQALSGKFSIADLFMSPEGLMLTTLFATGGLMSVAWLGKTTYNLVLALTYTSYKQKGADLSVVKKMRSAIELERL